MSQRNSAFKVILSLSALLLLAALVAAQNQMGQLSIFLVNFSELTQKPVVKIEKMILHSSSTESPLEVIDPQIDLSSNILSQILVAQSYIHPEEYGSLSFELSWGGPPQLIDSTTSEQRQTIEMPVNAIVRSASAETIFLEISLQLSDDSPPAIQFHFEQIFKKTPPPSALGFVSNQGSDNVSYFDRSAGEVVGSILVGKAPRGMAILPTKNRLFVANSSDNSISVIDVQTLQVVSTINLDFGDEPEALCISRDERWLCVANRGSNSASVIDIRSLTMAGKIGVGIAPVDIAADPNSDQIYVVNNLSNDVSIFQPDNLGEVFTVFVGSSPTCIDFDRKQKAAYVAVSRSGKIVRIDTVQKLVTTNYNTAQSIQSMFFDEFSGDLYCSVSESRSLSIFRPALNLEINEISTVEIPFKLAIDSEKTGIYLTNPQANCITMINRTSGNLTRFVASGLNPYMVVFP
ncbi:MAG: beta-propeller fold lactonase family protein [bacterium]|nr:beta-propeller fold lactonase family protein [bacterium]